jgi:hypothetical protein
MITYSSNRVGSALSILWAILFASDVRDTNARTALRTAYHYRQARVKKEQRDTLKALVTHT